MKFLRLALVLLLILLSGCSHLRNNPFSGQSVIDWVDFVKLNERSYTVMYNNLIKDPNDITQEIAGEVKFKVADVVTNPSYRTKAGDAAFLPIGTKLYRVKGFERDEVIAAKDKTYIGGYRIYMEDSVARSFPHHYKDMPKEQVERINLYHQHETIPFKILNNSEQAQFIQLLETGEDTQNYPPQRNVGDPVYYKMVFYTIQPFAYVFLLGDDGLNVFFHPWDTRIIDDAIRELLR